MAVLVTGSAGFIGFHVVRALLAQGRAVIGIDNLNGYYDVGLKAARLDLVSDEINFKFLKGDITDPVFMAGILADYSDISIIIHLAAQAGVRYSLENPRAYVQANIVGQLELLELARFLPGLKHFVYASSSSVYGANADLPYSTAQACSKPQSLYAATKQADELMTYTYAHLYGIKATGLRFFTVYGPWGRPDMAPFLFTKAILAGQPIHLFNQGQMQRDFTYIDDIVAGVMAALDHPPETSPPHRLFNLGNHRAETLDHFVTLIEQACGRSAQKILAPMQPGDVLATYADISETTEALGFRPVTPIEIGIPRFVEWYRRYYQV